ncbi:PLP-dependent aminotransferase family protein [Sneathiella sp.]|jgi:GntR family transcriptional regulator/MocR family aminotransferase|uniref:MocR-like pyridoxine biosynthesis transcription factor PdxR n=1 Tax=Sneathiella sp. TaxID=1964365 RepID=UPI0039E5D4FF
MTYRRNNAYLASLSLDPQSGSPLHKQLFLALREAILDGRIRAGIRLPSTRSLANDLQISRNTVLSAFDQLLAEGYIVSKVGAGSFVSDQLPEDFLKSQNLKAKPGARARKVNVSARAQRIAGAQLEKPHHGKSFSPGMPELQQFPFEDWARLLGRHWRHPKREFLVGNPIGGSVVLRKALADHLGQTRSVKCDADQILVLSGSQQAIHLVIKAFADINDPIWMEEPGYPGIRDSIISAGAKPISVPVDEEGFQLDRALELAPQAPLACISPSHQYPLGHTMSLARRIDLLGWAKENDRFILEDDYDSEYRYTGRPLSSLQGLDNDNRVLYIGTMSKVMFPGLRIGYLVVPPDLVDLFLALRKGEDGHSPAVAEAALAEFISEGYLASHIRRMRLLYQKRQQTLVTLLQTEAAPWLTVVPQESGMHLIAHLTPRISDKDVEQKTRIAGMLLRSLSSFYQKETAANGLIIGFAGTDEKEMPQLVHKLVRILQELDNS